MSPLIAPVPSFNPVSTVLHAVSSVASVPVKAAASVALSAVSSWIVTGAEAMLHEVVTLVSAVTTPSLSVSWFSGSYWRVSGLAMLLTVPFLFAAAVQAVVRSDMGVLVRAAFFDLPIAVLAVTLAAPVITLLLAATDEMCTLVTGNGPQGADFLDVAATDLAGLRGGVVLAIMAVLILLAGLVLTVELIMRSAAIYIVVLFLPLGFAAMVWPARRVWIKRMVELLIALILSKFAMVAILSLAVAGLASVSSGGSSLTTGLTAMALLILAAFSPWALLWLLPFTELAAGAGEMLHHETGEGVRRGRTHAGNAEQAGVGLADPVLDGISALRNFATGSPGAADGRGVGGGRASLAPRRSGGQLPSPDGPADGGPSGGGPAGEGGGPAGSGSSPGGGAAASIFPAFDEGVGAAAAPAAADLAAGVPAASHSAVATTGPAPGQPGGGSLARASSGGEPDAGPSNERPILALPNPGAPVSKELIGDPAGGPSGSDRLRAHIGSEEQPGEINLADPNEGFVIPAQGNLNIAPDAGSEEPSGQ